VSLVRRSSKANVRLAGLWGVRDVPHLNSGASRCNFLKTRLSSRLIGNFIGSDLLTLTGYVFRRMFRSPGFSAMVVVTIALVSPLE
jgi:hypothetical protein